MTSDRPPETVRAYLDELRRALKGAPPGLISDALADTEDHLNNEIAHNPEVPESEILASVIDTYGTPQEIAEEYRDMEATIGGPFPKSEPAPQRSFGFFNVISDPRTYGALLYMLLSLVTGIVYFTFVVTGTALSVGLMITIIGVPLALVVIGMSRLLAHMEGRIVEGLLGVRMPRRPLRSTPGTLGARIKEMLLDLRTWTTLLYMLLMLPLGVCYFTAALVAVVLSAVSVAAPLVALLHGFGLTSADIQFDGEMIAWPLTLPLCVIGIFAMTAVMHGVRLLGELHGRLARALLLSRDGE